MTAACRKSPNTATPQSSNALRSATVKMRKSHSEHFSTAVPQKADVVLTAANARFVPTADSCTAANHVRGCSTSLDHFVGAAKQRAPNREQSSYPTTRIMVKSARRRAMLRVQRRTPGQWVAKNHYVRRQLRRPRSFPLSQNFARCCTKHCNRVPKLHLFRARPKSTHPWTPINSLTPAIPKES